jgi:hypothetical protein
MTRQICVMLADFSLLLFFFDVFWCSFEVFCVLVQKPLPPCVLCAVFVCYLLFRAVEAV